MSRSNADAAPVLIAAFEGWNDAAGAASDAAQFLLRACNAVEIWSVDPERYFDFQAARPSVEIVNGVTRSLRWPSISVHRGSAPRTGREIVFVVGPEPNLQWPRLCAEILDLARPRGVGTVVTLGALLGDAPHTRPLPVTGTANDTDTIERLGLRRSSYEGPTGIVGVFAEAARRAGFDTASLWVPVPHYVSSAPCPKATLALLERLARLLDLDIELRNLVEAAQHWEAEVNTVLETDGDLIEYVHQLEHRFDNDISDDWAADDDAEWFDDDDEWDDESDWDDDTDRIAEADLPSGETLAADFERYLREHGDDA